MHVDEVREVHHEPRHPVYVPEPVYVPKPDITGVSTDYIPYTPDLMHAIEMFENQHDAHTADPPAEKPPTHVKVI